MHPGRGVILTSEGWGTKGRLVCDSGLLSRDGFTPSRDRLR